jgi:crescentin
VTARENAYNYAQQKIQEQSDLVQLLESEIKAGRDANELQIEQLEAQLQREKLERSMAEGALEAGRKDVSRLLRELGATEYQPLPSSPADIDEPQAQDRFQSAA